MQKKPNKYMDSIRKVLGRALSPAFLLILLSSCLLWYMAKLSHEYTAEIPLKLRIDGRKYRVEAVVTGRGSMLMAHQLSLKKVSLRSEDLTIRPSKETPGVQTITKASLQKALTNKLGDLKIVQIEDITDFVPTPNPPVKTETPETK
jgi:hypothetical protein